MVRTGTILRVMTGQSKKEVRDRFNRSATARTHKLIRVTLLGKARAKPAPGKKAYSVIFRRR